MSNNNQNIEKLLRGTVIVLSVSIVAVLVLLVKGVFLETTDAPRTNIEKQLYDAQKAIEENPKDLDAHILLGATYTKMGKYDEAEAEFNNVINADKNYSKAYYFLADNYEKQNKKDEAISTYKKLESEEALFQIGRLYFESEKYKDAIDYLKQALKKKSSGSDTLYYLGLSYEKEGSKEEAIKSYKDALKYAPDYKEAKEALDKIK